MSLHPLAIHRPNGSWPCAVPEMGIADFRFVPLDTPERMAEEALAMDNDLGERSDTCRLGAARYYSIRDAGTDERLAVLELTRDKRGAWKPTALKGPAEREVDDLGICLAASWLAFEYEKRDRRGRERRALAEVIQLRRSMPAMLVASAVRSPA